MAQQFATYRNMYTGKIAKYLRSETVPDDPSLIRLHILLIDGKEDSWNDDVFFKSWHRV